MAQRALEAAVRYIRRVSGRGTAPQNDRQLLKDFVSQGDGAAFATLIERHGSLVYGVCRRVLGNRSDAEDVFQATFLVLARKACTVRWRPSVGPWLSSVAYRLAKKVRVEEARRRALDPCRPIMTSLEPVAEASLRELQSVVDEEIQRLPEKLRAPVVLCYLGARSNEQAALELGCSTTTVKGRLNRARNLLRSRLASRGMGLSLALPLPGLGEASTSATAALIRSTRNLAVLCRAGDSLATGAISAKVTALANSAYTTTVGLGTVSLAVAIALIIATAAAGVGLILSQPTVPDPNKLSSGITDADSDAATASDGKSVHLSAAGTVTDEQGNPIAGSAYSLPAAENRAAIAELLGSPKDPTYTDILAKTITDATGRFSFADISAQPLARPGNIYQHPWDIVVQAKGRGMAWHLFRSDDEQELKIVMKPESRLHGRLLDDKGKPAAGVLVSIEQINDKLEPEGFYEMGPLLDLLLIDSKVPRTAITDADGRFLMDGLPRDFHINLKAQKPGFARKWLSCATIDTAQIDRFNALAHLPKGMEGRVEVKMLGDGFTANLQPSKTLRGRIVFGDTKQPVIGAHVSCGIVQTVTDKEGRYAFPGLETRKYNLFVTPPENVDYLGTDVDVSLTLGSLEQEKNFALVRGSTISGQLREKESGMPIKVADVMIHFRIEDPERPGGGRALGYCRTKSDGSYRIVVAPSKGWLESTTPLAGFVLPEMFGERTNESFIGTEPFEIKSGETLKGKDLFYEKGMVVEGRVLDLDGKPVPGAQFRGALEYSSAKSDGAFSLQGLSRKKETKLIVIQRQRKLGAEILIKPSADSNPIHLDITLPPTQTANGRVVDDSSNPIANAQVTIWSSIWRVGLFDDPVRTDTAGRYSFQLLPVDGSFRVRADARGIIYNQSQFTVRHSGNTEIGLLVLPGRERRGR